ncbi:YdcF family protein [Tolypothrix campylonemoides VB511288]|nr:YdcF family protein [Tolypothrix campylonemoides VB511288]
MLERLNDLVVALTYPPLLSLCVAMLGALAFALRWRRSGVALFALAFAWSAVWSLPASSRWLRGTLEQRNPQVAASALPRVDAIVVLGGGDHYRWLERADVSADDLPYSRLAAGARAWHAERAPWVVLSGGGAIGRTEADMMARAIGRLDVPASALLLETESRDTRDNARNTAELARARGIRRIVLVTSALHMPRAAALFRAEGLEVTAMPVPEGPAARDAGWLPSPRALWRSGRALKEHLALVGDALGDCRRG